MVDTSGFGLLSCSAILFLDLNLLIAASGCLYAANFLIYSITNDAISALSVRIVKNIGVRLVLDEVKLKHC